MAFNLKWLLLRKRALEGSRGLSNERREATRPTSDSARVNPQQAAGNIATQRLLQPRASKDRPSIDGGLGPGEPLHPTTRARFESKFKRDLSDVRIHKDSGAGEAARALGARAFVHGRHICFGPGQYNPTTEAGRRLLAHELSHTLQQEFGRRRGSGPLDVTDPEGKSEREADHSADAYVRGRSVNVTSKENAQLACQQDAGVPGGVPETAVPTSEPSYGAGTAARDVSAATGGIIEIEAILRTLYQRADEAIVREAEYMLSQAVSQGADPKRAAEEVARWTVNARNQAKVAIRRWDLDVLRLLAERSNLRKYGHPVGPTYEQLRYGDPSKGMRPRSDLEIIEGAKKTRPSVNKWVGRLRIAGRIMIAVDIGISAWTVATAPEVDRPRVLLREIGGLAGAIAGGWAGAKLGGMIGGAIGAWVGGAGAVPGAGIGAFIGGIAGAIGGGLAGRAAGELVADELYPPEQTGFEGVYQ